MKHFLSEVYPAMVFSQNGIDEHFLYSVVKLKAMTRKETQVILKETDHLRPREGGGGGWRKKGSLEVHF